jgi:flavin reductase (DIM6/NTAB) family NADH-FMN oxidoreductase RutF
MKSEDKKQVLRKMTYGLWVMSTAAGSDMEASTVTWVTQMSFVPPLVGVGVRQNSHLHEVVERSSHFALHLIVDDRKDLAETFIKPTEIKDGKIGGLNYKMGLLSGAPILEGFPAWMELKVIEIVKRGDHSMVVGEVIDAEILDAECKPLVLASTGWHYGG